MSEYIIMTDSSCDLPQWKVEELGLEVVNLTVDLDGKIYTNYLDWREIEPKEFYDGLRAQKPSKTSAANIGDFREAMEPVLKAGKDILYIGFSTGLSGTYNAGRMAAEELREEYPDRKIFTVDSLCAALGQGLFVVLAAEEKAKGKSIEEVAKYCEDTRLNLAHWFTVSDLFFLHRGGRVSAATAIVGSTLGIKPVMHVDNEGKLVKVEVARGRKGSLKKLVEHMKESYTSLEKVYISHGDCEEEAKSVGKMITDQFEVGEMVIHHIGPVIGSHAGPGTMALFFVGKER